MFGCTTLLLHAADSTSHQGTSSPDADNRPTFISHVNSAISIGGYTDANASYSRFGDNAAGVSMEMRRFNLFFYSAISSSVKLMAEVEFEHGTDEISLETGSQPASMVRRCAPVDRPGTCLAQSATQERTTGKGRGMKS